MWMGTDSKVSVRLIDFEHVVLASIVVRAEAIDAYRADPVVEKDNTLTETFATSKTSAKAWGKIVDWKTMLITAAICGAAGAIICSGAFLIAGGTTVVSGIGLGWGALVATSAAQASAIGAGIGSAAGATFGIAYPTIFASLTQKVADLLSGRTVRGKTQFGNVKTALEMQQEAVQNRKNSEPDQRLTSDHYKDRPLSTISQVVATDRLLAPERQLTA
jgi:hypothetical protein